MYNQHLQKEAKQMGIQKLEAQRNLRNMNEKVKELERNQDEYIRSLAVEKTYFNKENCSVH